MLPLDEYKKRLQAIEGGTIPVSLALEIVAAAEHEVETRAGEFTISQAVERSGKSRSWFERRLEGWREEALARQVAGVWFLKAAVIPTRAHSDPDGYDPSLSDDTILAELRADDQAA